ncbi:MAG TPA: hypothetical protein VE821_07780, partial [Pyrinomonadaceae bacterium]|nr:hypothetical protein [Pyrinomonadaceae bacterium]
GFSSLRYLTLELIRRRPALRMVDGDPWRVVLAATADELAPTTDAPVEVPTIETEESAPPIETPAETDAVNAQLREQIIERVRQFVTNSLEPVDMARAAFDVIRTFGPQVTETEWAGTGSFKQLLQGAAPLDFEIVTAPNQPGYLYDPARHAPPVVTDPTVAPLPDKLDRLAPVLADFVRRVSQVTGAPRLTPEEYALVFKAIADDLAERPFNLTYTSKAVRDYCLERGAAIPRKSVWFVLQGITFTGHRFGKDPEQDESAHLAQVFRDDVLKLCEDAGLELLTDERQLLDDWLMRGLTGEPQTCNLLRVSDEPLELPTEFTDEGVEAPEPIPTPLD